MRMEQLVYRGEAVDTMITEDMFIGYLIAEITADIVVQQAFKEVSMVVTIVVS